MPGDAGGGALQLPEQREKAGELGMKQEEPWTDACAAASFEVLQIDNASETKAAQKNWHLDARGRLFGSRRAAVAAETRGCRRQGSRCCT